MRPPAIPRLSTVFSQSHHRFRERDFAIECRACRQERNLSRCTTRSTGEVRTYRCPQCADLLVTIGFPVERGVSREDAPAVTWWSVHPASDLFVQFQNSRLTIPPTPVGRIFGEPLL